MAVNIEEYKQFVCVINQVSQCFVYNKERDRGSVKHLPYSKLKYMHPGKIHFVFPLSDCYMKEEIKAGESYVLKKGKDKLPSVEKINIPNTINTAEELKVYYKSNFGLNETNTMYDIPVKKEKAKIQL